MPSQFFGLNIAASGLAAFQTSLNTTANNIANVQTVGYTRQTTTLEASEPMRVYARYGSTGTGVSATKITQERNLYYDTKYWENNSSYGFFMQKLYYIDQVQEALRDDSVQDGFNTILSKMFNGLDTLKTTGEDESVRNQFINQAQMLCTYFNSLSVSLKEIQETCNEEIKSSVSNINSIAQKIASLNKEINMIEVRGGHANELRDQRANLVDELSEMVNVETQEYDVHNTYGQDLGGTNYRVIINGQLLVDGNEYRTLDCLSPDYKLNLTDAEGMYSIVWSDTGMDFAATAGSSGGSLKALFAVRDGNNTDNLRGTISAATTNTITLNNLVNKDPNALNIPTRGQVSIGNTHYTYDGWTANVKRDEETGKEYIDSITFNMDQPLKGNVANLTGKPMACGISVDAMGVPYYQAQINEFLRNFTQAFNNIERNGVTQVASDVDGQTEKMGSFFVGDSKTGFLYDLDPDEDGTDGYYAALARAEEKVKNGQEFEYTLSSDMDSYYKITASTVKVNDRSLRDANYFATASEIVNGKAKYDIAEQLLTLQSGVKMFRGDTAESFLETLLSDITVDVNKTEIYSNNYSNLKTIINNQRISVSGVDEDEEAMNLVKFQNAYNLASKMISVMAEIYNKLINETGVT